MGVGGGRMELANFAGTAGKQKARWKSNPVGKPGLERFYSLDGQYLTHAAALFSICIRHSRDVCGWGDGEGAWI